MRHRNGGSIEVIYGPMFSDKTGFLIRLLIHELFGRHNVIAFKPQIDDRISQPIIKTRSGISFPAITIKSPQDIHDFVTNDITVIGTDETQFFDDDILEISEYYADKGVRVVHSGLNKDAMRKPFGPMGSLIAISDEAYPMHARCVFCGKKAYFSQLLDNNSQKDAIINESGNMIRTGDTDDYCAVCRKHHQKKAIVLPEDVKRHIRETSSLVKQFSLDEKNQMISSS